MGSVIIRKRVLWDPYRWDRIRPEWVEELSPEEDRLLLEWLANHAREPGRNTAIRKLASAGLPVLRESSPDRDTREQYRVMKEQTEREDDREMLRRAAMGAPPPLSHFAKNRITGGRDPSPEDDSQSFMTCECRQLPGITPEEAAEFERKWKQHMLRRMLPPGYKLFEPFIRGTWTTENVHMIFDTGDITRLCKSCDRLLLENIARHSDRLHRWAALRRLEVEELPESGLDPEEERYRILMEQVQRIHFPEYLEEAASGKRDDAGRAAFCRLTGYVFREDGARGFACSRTEEATPEWVRAFCERMVKENGPFAEEAAEWLKENGQSGMP